MTLVSSSIDEFVHLHNHSEYSLLDGYGHVADMAARAAELGQPAMALTDHGNLYAAIDFYKATREAGVKPIIGMEGYVAFGSRHDRTQTEGARGGSQPHITLLAQDLAGYRNLMALSSKSHLEGFYYRPRVDRELLAEHAEGIVVLSGCLSGELARDILRMEGDLSAARETAGWYREIFADRYFLELMHHEHVPGQDLVNRGVIELSSKMGIDLVVTNDCHYVYPEDAPHQDVLTSIITGSKLADQNRLRMEDSSYYIKSAAEMSEMFGEQPQALRNTLAIAERCNLELPLGQTELPRFPTPSGLTSEKYLRDICFEGARKRFGELSSEVRERLEKELHIISETGFADYFLVVWDIFKFVKRREILSTVRGSAASSLVLFCLEVTDFDPMLYGLFFERFLNLERREMPDIDMEFADDRRGEVINYCLKRYGADHVAQITTFGTMRSRAAIRDVARVLEGGDIDDGQIRDACNRLVRIAAEHSQSMGAADDDDDAPREHNLETIHRENAEIKRLCRDNTIAADILERAKGVEGRVRNVSTHAAGVVISDDPLVNHVPLQRPTKSGNSEVAATQYSMYPLEYVGLLKWDFLGLTNLGVLDRCLKIIEENGGEAIDIYQVPLDDEATFALMGEGDTFGSFQLEGGGMTRYIKELKPSSLLDVAAMIALYRPGPMQHIEQFINAKHGRAEIEYPHPSLKHLVEETYGVIVYQDQVMLAAQDFAGYTLGEADILRKAMGKKVPEIMREEEMKFVAGAVSQGHSEQEGRDLFSYILPFAGYGFNKAHAVSYAYITYWTTYFKAHYPTEYFVALLESFAGAPDRVRLCTLEAKRKNIDVLPPDINVSNASFTVDRNIGEVGAIRYGLASIKGVGAGAVQQIVDIRDRDGRFKDIDEFCDRMAEAMLGESVLKSLIMAGAFDSLAPRMAMLDNLPSIVSHMRTVGSARAAGQGSMFDSMGSAGADLGIDFGQPQENGGVELAQVKEWERELFGVALTEDPEETKLREHLLEEGSGTIVFASSDKLTDEGRQVRVVGKIVNVERRSTRNGNPFLSVTLAMLDGELGLTVWSQTMERTEGLWHEDLYLVVNGSVRVFSGDASVDVSSARLYQPVESSRKTRSRTAQPSRVKDARVDYSSSNGVDYTTSRNGMKMNGASPSRVEANGDRFDDQGTLMNEKPENSGGGDAVTLFFKNEGSGSVSRERLHRVLLSLGSHRGDGQVLAKLEVGKKVVSLEFPFFKVEPSEELREELSEILGEENVLMKKREA